MDKEAVIDEVHYMTSNSTIRLEHGNIVKNSFLSNVPVMINYKEGTITTSYPGCYTPDEDGKFEVKVSYFYHI